MLELEVLWELEVLLILQAQLEVSVLEAECRMFRCVNF